MPSPVPETAPLRGESVVRWSAYACLCLGLVVLAGWGFGVEPLKRILPGLVTMKVNTALGFVLAGLALHFRRPDRKPAPRFSEALAAGVMLLGLVTLSQSVFGFDAGIDELLLLDDPQPTHTGTPGRMAPGSALAFALLGGALLCSSRWQFGSQLLASAMLLLGFLGLLGYLYGIDSLYRLGPYTSIALHTCAGVLVAGIGALFVRPSEGIAAALLDPTEAGRELRRLIPVATIGPVALGALAMVGVREGWYDAVVETAVLVIAMLGVFVSAAFVSYSALSRALQEGQQARSEVEASERRYRRTFDNAAIGIAHLNPNGRWLRVNPRLCEMLGYDEAELVSMTYAQVSHLDDVAADAKQWELLRRGEIADYAVERRFMTQQGDEIYAEVRLVRQESESGRLLYVIAVIQDLTAQKISEGTLRVYERAISATQNSVMITDALTEDFPIVYVNPAFVSMTGYEAPEIIGKNARFLNERARDQTALEAIRRALKAGEECSVLLRNHRKNGEPFWNQLSIAPVEDLDGRVTHYIGVTVDATEREELLQAAESANQAKDRFLSVVSHEMRSPMNAVLAWTSILQDAEDDATRLRAIESIKHSVRTQTRLVDDLLDASRIRRGTLEVLPARIDLAAVVRAAVDRRIPLASEAGVSLEHRIPAGLAEAMADAERIGQVLGNLIENAIKFTPSGGRIEVTLEDQEKDWLVQVRDNGRGISKDGLPFLFDEFWQEGREGTSGGKGLGLGLALVKHLVERHGGTVQAESQGPDHGAVFRISLPKEGMPRPFATGGGVVAEAAPQSTDSAQAVSLAGLEIVVVDDDEVTVEAIGMALEKLDAIVRLATSVSEALRFFEQGAPDVVVSDIGLPDRDGLDLIQSIRQLPEPKCNVPAIAVTGLAERAERQRIQRLGFDAYLPKPIEPAQVVDRIQTLQALARAPTPPSRRVLVVDADDARAGDLVNRLRELGQVVRRETDGAQALRVVDEFQPDVVLACDSNIGIPAPALAERLGAEHSQILLAGVLSDEEGTDQQGYDYVLKAPVESEALERLLRLGTVS